MLVTVVQALGKYMIVGYLDLPGSVETENGPFVDHTLVKQGPSELLSILAVEY